MLMQPKPSSETCRPPSFRFFMVYGWSPVRCVDCAAAGLAHAAAPTGSTAPAAAIPAAFRKLRRAEITLDASSAVLRGFKSCVLMFNLTGGCSWLDHHLDGLPLVHRAVAVRNSIKVRDTIEDESRLYPAL